MDHYSDVIADLAEPTKSLREASPDTWAGFAQLHKAAVADGALSARVKELMALSIRGGQAVRWLYRLPRQGRSATRCNPGRSY